MDFKIQIEKKKGTGLLGAGRLFGIPMQETKNRLYGGKAVPGMNVPCLFFMNQRRDL